MTHVLIVEDHEESRDLLRKLLEANGYRVTAAGDGLEALAAARLDRPDAIVSGALMPNMDGFALCRRWMQHAGLRAIPFIFYSATYVHHERMDGSGYPQELKGEAILLEARIMAVADVIEAMSSHRPYRAGLGIEAALAEIERGGAHVYDPVVAGGCLKLFREKGYAIPA